MSSFDLQESLQGLPCHFTWKEMVEGHFGRTVEMNIDYLAEHIEQTIQGSEVESYNLMGFYKTIQKSFREAREHFDKALDYTKTDDEKIVARACLVWLTWKESNTSSESSFQDKIEEVKRMINERESDNIPDVLAEKAFSIVQSGFHQRSFTEAHRCIIKALSLKPKSLKLKFIKGIITKNLYKLTISPCSTIDKSSPKFLEMQKNWKEIIETPKEDIEHSSTIYVMSLIEYAEFLLEIKRDIEACRKEAEKVERIADMSNATIMRKLAELHMHSAKHNTRILEKAERILNAIHKRSPNCFKTNQLRGLLFSDKFRFAAKDNKEKYFKEARSCLYRAWCDNDKRDVSPAIHLVRLYHLKYENTTETKLINDIEDLFREIFNDMDKLHISSKALVHEQYGKFLKSYVTILVESHLKVSQYYRSQDEEYH